MPPYIKDDATAHLVNQLAKIRGVSKQDAVRDAVKADLDRVVHLRDQFAQLRAAYALPPPTGEIADKSFFDELSGGL